MIFRSSLLGTVGVSAGVAALIFSGAEYRLAGKRAAAAEQRAHVESELTEERAAHARLSADGRGLREFEAEQQRRLEAEAAATRAAAKATETAAIGALRKEALQTLAALKKQQVVTVMGSAGRPGAFTQERDGSLPPAFAEAFGLTPDEFGALKAAMVEMKNQLDQIALAHAVVTRTGEAVVTIEVPDRPEFFVQRDRLRSALQAALGLERFEAFETLQQGGVDRVFQGLGGPRFITVTRGGPELQRGHRISTRTRSVDASPGSYGGEASITMGTQEIVRQLGALAKLLPENFF
jgi:hypothetical protein